MLGILVYLCLAKEYIRKHNVEKEKEFFEGTLYPDTVQPKKISHYSSYWFSNTNLYQFLLK